MVALVAYGPDVVNAVLGGVIAGLVAFGLLKVTQKHEQLIRQQEQEYRNAEAIRARVEVLLVSVQNLCELLTSTNIHTVMGASTYILRNQVTVAEMDMSTAIMQPLRVFADYSREFRNWMRVKVTKATFEPGSPELQLQIAAQNAIREYALVLTDHLQASAQQRSEPFEYPKLPTLGQP